MCEFRRKDGVNTTWKTEIHKTLILYILAKYVHLCFSFIDIVSYFITMSRVEVTYKTGVLLG
jgi:hypothetical protein